MVLDRHGLPVVGGDYISMRNGLVTSGLFDIMNAGGCLANRAHDERGVSADRSHEVHLEQMPLCEHVSDMEVALANQIWIVLG